MKRLSIFLCAIILVFGLVSCGKNETRSVFDGYSLGMSRDEIANKLGKPTSTFDALQQYSDTYDGVSYFGLSGFLRFFYSDKDNPVLTGICWGTSGLDNIKTLSEKETEINKIITLYDSLYGEHKSYISNEYDDSETTVYEWKDLYMNTITLELVQYPELGHIVLEISRE